MRRYPESAGERAMKIQEVILRAHGEEDHLVAGGGDHRDFRPQMRRWRQRYEEHGYDGSVGPAARQAESQSGWR